MAKWVFLIISHNVIMTIQFVMYNYVSLFFLFTLEEEIFEILATTNRNVDIFGNSGLLLMV